VKYLTFIMRADNEGEGGILALLALLPEAPENKRRGKLGVLVALVLFGAALLYGDGMLTPAISVLSAVEGLEVATDTFKPAVVPITVAILLGLFAVQHRGTETIGRVFGPVMVIWFTTLGVLGVRAILRAPSVLAAIDPRHAVDFFQRNGFHGFVVLGAVVLCITGGEALYADMGHFGRKPIQLAWYGLVLPALVINYFGQGAMILSAPEAMKAEIVANPFYSLVPSGPAVYPLVAIATCATIIASQALISGAYSLTRQAVQLGYLPRVTITHTSSTTEGQIYIPEINWLLAVGCLALVLAFKSSSNLAAAYGIAVTGTMAITSIAYYVVARQRWKWPLYKIVPLVSLFLAIDLAFLGSNALKFFHGGFVPVVVALGIFFAMAVWKQGRALLGAYFTRAARPLDAFLAGVGRGAFDDDGEILPLTRVQGAAVFLTSNASGTPPLLLHHARHNKAIHENVLLVTVLTERRPRVTSERIRLEPLAEGFHRLFIRVGFMETPNVPRAIGVAIKAYKLPFEMKQVTYYLGRETLLATSHGEMSRRAEAVFGFLTKNSQNATRYFAIPPERVVEIGMQIDL
jgi:KUP system potassium uptake protein